MRSRFRSRLSKWLLAAILVLGMGTKGSALPTAQMMPPNHCYYCWVIFGHVICFSTDVPIDDDIGACMY